MVRDAYWLGVAPGWLNPNYNTSLHLGIDAAGGYIAFGCRPYYDEQCPHARMSEQVRHGLVHVSDGLEAPSRARLRLTEDYLTVQREELVYTHTNSDVDAATLAKERTVHIHRERVGGLGLSVKGGREHNLPVLISRIFKDQAADRSGQLFVGDAIIKVNNSNIESCCHDDAVQALKNAGDDVTLLVKYFRPASVFLNRNRRQGRDEENNHADTDEPRLEKQWTDAVTVPLLYAYTSRYLPGTDKMRASGFEVIGVDGSSSGVVHCEDTQTLTDWVQCINHNIQLLNIHHTTLQNKLLIPSQQVVHMCWTCERMSATRHWQAWKPQFLALKGSDVCLFDIAPIKNRDWLKCERTYKIYECLLRILKDSEMMDGRQYCFVLQSGGGDSHYLSMDSRQDLLSVEKGWYRATYQGVRQLGSKTFGCTWRERISGLTLDLNVGFSLYDSESKYLKWHQINKSYMWSYRFSQLKGSSDDGKTKLKLHFLDDQTQNIETREIECTNLQTLLFSMHAFLSAKLASVDPAFLTNL